ncbi:MULTISPECIES: hypothetical protein [Bacillus cereus group]|nr:MULTISPECIES: hypothetical protein [Bacillus cereus group]HDR7646147.1 hypothetical protein [Bacillus mycoides]MBJ8044552.1 hypothetical protein [Bacillus cereus group sp. N17]HDR3908900.1 hypothetical protein [Bacillus toyonensis]HDR7409605.1 hypothetical protein [Bacillus toyonensis]HDR7850048.1 hypothetical protein [Bacillus toyonensis]
MGWRYRMVTKRAQLANMEFSIGKHTQTKKILALLNLLYFKKKKIAF